MNLEPRQAGPVSTFLEDELRTWVRRHGIVVWLDLDSSYSAFVDRLMALDQTGDLPYRVRAFRGSHLQLMMELEGVTGGADNLPLVIHLPGFNEDSVKETPLLELYSAGVRFRKALGTLVAEAASGQAPPDQVELLVEQGGLTLDGADAWLSNVLAGDALAGGEGGLAAQLRLMQPTAVLDDLLAEGFVAGQLHLSEARDLVWRQWTMWTGLPTTWGQTTQLAEPPMAKDLAFAVASWCLCVEYVDDLKRRPVSPLLATVGELTRGVIEAACGIAQHLRRRHPDIYQQTAEETESLLADEVDAAQAEDLGQIDTFRFEESKVLTAALVALDEGRWDVAAAWAERRVTPEQGRESFWLKKEPMRVSCWQLVEVAAALGQAILRAGPHLPAGESLGLAVDAYVERGAAVDRAHRHLEQRVGLLEPQLPEFETLRNRLDSLRTLWRHWADAWSRDWNLLCRRHGFLPASNLQQRTLFDEVVKPLVEDGSTTAYFVIDAFRYEMGQELHRQLVDTAATEVHLKPRLAELPTLTEVGMNVLAPVCKNGQLSPAFSTGGKKLLGFSTGEFRVSDAETRRRAMHDRVGGATCPSLELEDVVCRDSASLRRSIAKARLVVVRSREADQAGEAGVGPLAFEQVMQKVRSAWRLLQDAGVRRFVFTADHGFLLLDASARGMTVDHGRKIDPNRRHVFSPVGADEDGKVRVALSELRYDGVEGHVIFPESTAVFNLGRRTKNFVHGGNSLQERVIPVLTVVHRSAAGGSATRYAISAEAVEGVAGMHCLKVTVEVEAQALDFGSLRHVEVGVRVPEQDAVLVELCQARGPATLVGGLVRATVGETFELFFRLSDRAERRVRVELFHPSGAAEVVPCRPQARFAVSVLRAALTSSEPSAEQPLGKDASSVEATGSAGSAGSADSADLAWLEDLPAGGVRDLFKHLVDHGTVTESEASEMLGGARGVRRFSRNFEQHRQKIPFDVRIDTVAGVKRYVREGGSG